MRPSPGKTAERLRPPSVGALPQFDYARFMQHLKVAAEVSVGERAQVLQVAEQHAFRPGRQGGEDAEPGAFMEQAVEPFVGKAPAAGSALRRFLFSIHQLSGLKPQVGLEPFRSRFQ